MATKPAALRQLLPAAVVVTAARRLALLAAAVAIASGGYVAIASAGPKGCDPAVLLNCEDPPPAQGPETPRRDPGRLPVDALPNNPGPVECPPAWDCPPSPPPTTTGPTPPPTTGPR
jgi:hypothetical protein